MRFKLSALVGATLLAAAPALMAQNLAIVNGKPVPLSRVQVLTEQVERSGRPVDDATREQIKQEIIMREVFAQEAMKRGVGNTAAFKAQLELSTQSILIRSLFEDFQSKNPVTDAEAQAEYDKFATENAGQEYRARHILVETETQAQALIAAIQGGAKFEELAQKESKDPGSGANGGDLDWAAPESFVPAFSQAMVALGKGEMTKTPVKSDFGWHIIRLDDSRKIQLPAFDEVKPQIQQQLQQQKLLTYQEGLRGKATIK